MSHAAFWKAICAEPDDDTPRLVFADWLDEQGDPASAARAEFIRAQIELARPDPWTERAIDLKIREQVLLREHRDEWLAELPKWANRGDVRFARGFPYSQRCTTAELAKNAARLAKDTVVQDVTLGDRPSVLRAHLLRTNEHLARIRGLECGREEILSSPHLTGLREWRFAENRHSFSAADFARLLNLPAVRGVSRLALVLSAPGGVPDQLRVLAAAPFTELRELKLRVFAWASAQIADVLRSPVADRLTAYSGFLDQGVFEALNESGEISTLKSVDFSVHGRTQEWMEWGFDAPLLRHVAALQLDGLSDVGLRLLAGSKIAEQLRALTLPIAGASFAAFRAAAETGRFRNLLALTLDVGSWERREYHEVANVSGLENVRHLCLHDLVAGSIGKVLRGLASSTHWPNLRAVTVPLAPAKSKELAAKYAGRFAVLTP